MSRHSYFAITVFLFLSLFISGCTRDTFSKVQTELLPGNEQILLRVKNDDSADIVVKSFAVFDEGDNVIKQSSDYHGWFPLVLVPNSAVEFEITADLRDEHRAIINISKNGKSYTSIVDCPAEN